MQSMEPNGMTFGVELAFGCIGLLVFGIGFNWLVEHMQKRTTHYTAELVVVGVLVTVAVAAVLIGIQNALIVLALFAASGAPMVIGSWVRTARDQEQAKREMLK